MVPPHLPNLGAAIGPLAQMARAPALQAGGRGFDSRRVHQPINFYEMKQTINWRHAVLLALMAVGLYLVGGEVESETAFFTIKPLGLAVLILMYRLHERWWREGKIAGYRGGAAHNRQS